MLERLVAEELRSLLHRGALSGVQCAPYVAVPESGLSFAYFALRGG
jgi:hypothetical protein